jgi:hypothetical protein
MSSYTLTFLGNTFLKNEGKSAGKLVVLTAQNDIDNIRFYLSFYNFREKVKVSYFKTFVLFVEKGNPKLPFLTPLKCRFHADSQPRSCCSPAPRTSKQ